MLKEEKIENTRYIYYIQNIHYIKENGNYYVKVVLPTKEFKISLIEGKKLIEKMSNDENLKRRLSKKGFCKFYRIVNNEYQEITFSEYKQEDSVNLKKVPKITFQKSYNPDFELLCTKAAQIQKKLGKGTTSPKDSQYLHNKYNLNENEKIENTRYIYYIQNIHYIKENSNYYIKVVLPAKEFKISLIEGRKLIEKMSNDENLKRRLSKKGFCKFYRIVNNEYQEITFSEYKQEDSVNLKKAPKITFQKSYNLNEIEKIYLYEVEENVEYQCIIYYKNGISRIKTKDETIQELRKYALRNNLSVEQAYDSGIIEEVNQKRINSVLKQYNTENINDEKDVGKIVLYKKHKDDEKAEKAIIFYTNGKTKIIASEEIIREILAFKHANNIKTTEQLFHENVIECVEEIKLYRNFESYRTQALAKGNNNQPIEEDDLHLIDVDKLDKTINVSHRRKQEKKNYLETLKNSVQKVMQSSLVKKIAIGLTVFTALVAKAYETKLVHEGVTGFIKEMNFGNANDKKVAILVGNQEIDLQIENALNELEKEMIEEKKKKEKTVTQQPIIKKSTIPQEEMKKSIIPAEKIIIEQQPKEEKQQKVEETPQQVEESTSSNPEESVQAAAPAEAVPENNAQTGGINYIATYSLTPEQLDIIKATVQHEAGFDEIEVTAVTSTVVNRCRSGRWGGNNPWSVITAPGQFSSYGYGYYTQYINGNYADYTDQIVTQMLSGESEPIHGYERFTGGGPGVQFTPGGNHYR